MAFSRRMGPKAAVLTALLGIATVVTASTSVPIAYCANLNTASTNASKLPSLEYLWRTISAISPLLLTRICADSSIYQSDGLCHDFCLDNFAFAIVQDANCWCTDYTPATSLRVDMSDCTTECPGFPDDICGGPGLWAYIQLSKAAAGTKGGADPTTAAATTTAQVCSFYLCVLHVVPFYVRMWFLLPTRISYSWTIIFQIVAVRLQQVSVLTRSGNQGITTTTVQNTVTVAPVAPISSPETASISPTPATTHTAIAVATTKSDVCPCLILCPNGPLLYT